MTGGNAFFLKEERDLHRDVEGFCPPDEEPRLNDPPAPGKTCGGCELLMDCLKLDPDVRATDEACGAWEGER